MFAMYTGGQISAESLLSILLGVYPEVGSQGPTAILFKLLWHHHTVFHPNVNVTVISAMESKHEGGQTPAPGEAARGLAAESSLRGPRWRPLRTRSLREGRALA